MDEIEVIQTIEELRKFLNDKNFMEIVVRQKNKRFKKFYKVALDNIFKETEQQAAKEVLKAIQKNSKILNQNLKMVKNLFKDSKYCIDFGWCEFSFDLGYFCDSI